MIICQANPWSIRHPEPLWIILVSIPPRTSQSSGKCLRKHSLSRPSSPTVPASSRKMRRIFRPMPTTTLPPNRQKPNRLPPKNPTRTASPMTPDPPNRLSLNRLPPNRPKPNRPNPTGSPMTRHPTSPTKTTKPKPMSQELTPQQLISLGRQYGTPLYVYHAEKIAEQYDK